MRLSVMIATMALLVACGDINVPAPDVSSVACTSHADCEGKVEGLSYCQMAVCDPNTWTCGPFDRPNGLDCNDQNPCTLEDWCFEGECVGKPLSCNDDNPCTNDFCNAEGNCEKEPNEEPCDDANRCTLGDVCFEGDCRPGSAPDCNDENDCTEDLCKPETGCVHQLIAGCLQECKDPGDCDDHNDCTTDECDGNLCVHNARDQEACNDGNECLDNDYCEGSVCVGHQDRDCNDKNPCTEDKCVQDSGCTHQFNNADCDDGDPCTSGDYCSGGDCKSGKPKNCDDNNICTDDYCSASGVCPSTSITPTGTDGEPVAGTPAACCHIGCAQPNPNCTSDGCRCGKNAIECNPKIADTCSTISISIGGNCVCGNTGGPCMLLNSCCVNGKCTTSCKGL